MGLLYVKRLEPALACVTEPVYIESFRTGGLCEYTCYQQQLRFVQKFNAKLDIL
jgi:hypothetical protein